VRAIRDGRCYLALGAESTTLTTNTKSSPPSNALFPHCPMVMGLADHAWTIRELLEEAAKS